MLDLTPDVEQQKERVEEEEHRNDFSAGGFASVVSGEDQGGKRIFLFVRFITSFFASVLISPLGPPEKGSSQAFASFDLQTCFKNLEKLEAAKEKGAPGVLPMDAFIFCLVDNGMKQAEADKYASEFSNGTFGNQDHKDNKLINYRRFFVSYVRMNVFHLVKILKDRFKLIAGSDNKVQVDELQTMLVQRIGEYAAGQCCSELFKQLDANGDGDITLKEVDAWYDKRDKHSTKLLETKFKPLGSSSFTTMGGEEMDLMSLLFPAN